MKKKIMGKAAFGVACGAVAAGVLAFTACFRMPVGIGEDVAPYHTGDGGTLVTVQISMGGGRI